MRELSADEIVCVHGGVKAAESIQLSPSIIHHHNTQLEAELFDDIYLEWVSPKPEAD